MLESVRRTGAQRPWWSATVWTPTSSAPDKGPAQPVRTDQGCQGVADVFRPRSYPDRRTSVWICALLEAGDQGRSRQDDTGSMTSASPANGRKDDDERLNLVGDTGDHGRAPTGESRLLGCRIPAAAGLWLDGLRAASALVLGGPGCGLDVDCSDVIDQLQRVDSLRMTPAAATGFWHYSCTWYRTCLHLRRDRVSRPRPPADPGAGVRWTRPWPMACEGEFFCWSAMRIVARHHN